MKKIIYLISLIALLFLISIIPTSAKEIKTCTRTNTNLHIPSYIKVNDKNLNNILSTPCVDNINKVYDFSDLLTDSEEELLYNEIISFINNNNYDLVLVITSDNSKTSQEYADDFYDYNDFGLNKTRDGVLILIDMDNRNLYISTTGYAIKMYDDYRIERIIDSGYDKFVNKEYYNSISSMIKTLNDYYINDYPESNKNLLISENGKPYYRIPYDLIVVLAIIISIIISLILYFKSRLKIKVLDTVSYLKKENITKRDDIFLNSVVTREVRSNDSSSGGSSYGGGYGSGGSSFHTSSSGSSHGGGGRSF